MAKLKQLGFQFPKVKLKWGGRRDGAGRKKTGKKYVAHRARAFHALSRQTSSTTTVVVPGGENVERRTETRQTVR